MGNVYKRSIESNIMTTEFKMPEPVQSRADVQMHGYQIVAQIAAYENLYTESQLKQAMREALEEAAKECDGVKTTHVDATGVGYQSTDDVARFCANKIRKLLEQVK